MDIHPPPWSPALALKPFLLTVSYLSIALFHLSFPHILNRFFVLITVSVFAGAAFLNSEDLFPDSYAEEIYLRFLVIWIAHFWSLSLKDAKTEDGVHILHAEFVDAPRNPWLRGYKLLFNGRGVGTTWEVPYLHRGSSASTTSPSQASKTSPKAQKTSPITRRLLTLVIYFSLLCTYYSHLSLSLHLPLRHTDTIPAKELLIRRFISPSHSSRITLRDLTVRLWIILDLIIPDYLILTLYHTVFALLFISTGLDTDTEWPPLFGRITDASSVRRYWGLFWHRLVYQSFGALAKRLLACVGDSS
ncbi:hypothetical protein NX059_007234 [Plenodomus lindquistii]|nr:hypothetical protein NX059_007234 [Plenodomus lindquistii]